jgi:hypothetical protein
MRDHETPPCSDERRLERPRYFQGQMLTETDLSTEQSYFLDKLRFHNRLLHGSGTVCGLAVEPTEPPSSVVVVRPGVAIDCCGREIVVTEPLEVDLVAVLDEARPPDRVYVTVAYGEIEVAPLPVVDDAGDTHQASRVREVPSVEVTLDRPIPPHAANAAVRPCPPCSDPRVVLATIDLSKRGPITAAEIDNGMRRSVGNSPPSGDEPLKSGRKQVSLRSAVCAAVGAALLGRLIARHR